MSDMRTTERLLEFIAEQTDDPKILDAVAELRRRGDTLVHMNDLRLIAAAANHGRRYGPGGDTEYTGFEAARARIEGALGGNPLSASPQSSGFQLAGPFRQGRHHTGR